LHNTNAMPFLSGKRAFLELLKQEGVDYIFGNPGTTELPLMDALATEKELRYVLGLQEAAVMAMADGYAQASGKLTAVSVHVAPGLGNAMGMLYDARKAGSPILVTAGQHPQNFSFSEPILWADLPEIARPFVKWSAEVRRLEDLPNAIHRAAKTALAPPTGPVFLSLPGDVLTNEGEIELGAPSRVAPNVRGDRTAIETAAALCAAADRPLIFAGDAVAQSGSHTEIVAFAELLGAPVYAEAVASRASFPASHPLFCGAMQRSQPAIREILARHDLLVSVGADLFALSLPSDVDALPEGLAIVHLDTDPWELAKNYPVRSAILGEPKVTLPELTAEVHTRMNPAQRTRARDRFARTRSEAAAVREELAASARGAATRTPIEPLALVHAIGETLPSEAVVVDETISSGTGLRLFLRSDDPQSFFGLRGGGIGWGLPAAIGAKLALPNRPVFALIGDGSAMYTVQALWTAAHERLAVTFVIFDNASYKILKQRARAMGAHAAQTGTYVGMDLNEPAIDFVALARSLGVEADRATTLEEVRTQLERGLKSGVPRLVDVVIAG
jgi:benzoylformate decarboxylase